MNYDAFVKSVEKAINRGVKNGSSDDTIFGWVIVEADGLYVDRKITSRQYDLLVDTCNHHRYNGKTIGDLIRAIHQYEFKVGFEGTSGGEVNDVFFDKIFFDVLNERQRRKAKGYDAAHDDADKKGNHACAAAYYATAALYQREEEYGASDEFSYDRLQEGAEYAQTVADQYIGYPWAEETKSVEVRPRDNLVKAAALIIAEIERIDREAAKNA